MEYKYNQILCCSSEKSLTSGYPGFGVRAKSPGLTNSEAEEIYLGSGLRYAVPVSDMVTPEVLRANPQLDAAYPHQYTVRELQTSQGKKFIVARVMYAGADYGFFNESGFNNRVGSNYVAHILVFDEALPAEAVGTLLRQRKFIPENTDRTFSNPEFKRLLAGEPFELPVGSVTADDRDATESGTHIDANLMIALLQAYKNRQSGKEICKVIYKTDTDKVEQTIASLGAMPRRLTENVMFNANVTGQTGIPLELGMIIVNDKDKSEIMDDYYIVADSRNGARTLKNVEQNYLFDRLRDAVTLGNIRDADMAAELYMQICNKPDANFEQAYRIMAMANTTEPVSVTDVRSLDLDLVVASHFPPAEETRLWNNIHSALDAAFSYPSKLSLVRTGLDIIRELNAIAPGKAGNIDKYGEVLNQGLFGNAELFQKLLEDNQERTDTALEILRKSRVEVPERGIFFKALSTTNNIGVWKKWLAYYYGGQQNLTERMEEIVDSVMEYGTRQTRALLLKLYPVESHCRTWIDMADKKADCLMAVKDELERYLTKGLHDAPKETVRTIRTISPEILEQLSPNIKEAAAISAGKAIERPVYSHLKLAVALDADVRYVTEMFGKWVKRGAAKEEVAEFVTLYAPGPKNTARLMDVLWEGTDKADRDSTFLWVTDHIKLNKYGMKDVTAEMEAKEAKTLLDKEKGFMKKMFRKFLGPKIMLLCLLCATVLAGCDEAKLARKARSHSPYRVEYYGDTVGTREVEIAEYSNKGNLQNIHRRRYSPSGQLLFSAVSNSWGGVDSVNYVYDNQEKLVDIKENNVVYSDFQYDNKNRLVSYQTVRTVTTGKKKKKKTKEVVELHQFTYDDDDNVTAMSVTNDNEEVASAKYTYNKEGKLRNINKFTKGEKEVTDLSTSSGRKLSEYKYSLPNGKLQASKKYNYLLTAQAGDSLYTYQVTITNKNGADRGAQVINRSLYTDKFVQQERQTAKQKTAEAKVSVIPKPVRSSNFFTNYVNDLKYRFAVNQAKTKSPTGGLLISLLLLTAGLGFLYFRYAIRHSWFRPFLGITLNNGMRRLWMFNKEPYLDVSLGTLIVLCAFISGVLGMMAIGGVTYGLLWLLKILLIALIWVGWIALILGGLALWGGEGAGCLPVILGGIIVIFRKPLRRLGEDLVDWGFDFMHKLNIFEWGYNLFVDFWDVILIVFVAPLVLFLAFAAVIIVLVWMLSGLEWLIMKIYGISRPCPVCGSKGDKEYWADQVHKHPVKLHPGIYGVFSHREPVTRKRMPTMLMNGKGKLLRRCGSCRNFITSNMEQSYGTEKHIGFVGNRSSGKSYLTYTLLDGIMKQYGSDARQIDSDHDTDISANASRVKSDAGIQTDLRDSYRAIQLILHQKLRPLPYHLFFYDVAGEKFNQKSTASKTAMDFYRNVEQIIFIIDPTTMDFSYSACSDKMEEWLKRNGSPERFSTEGVFSTLNSILEAAGRKAKSIDFIFAMVKSDMGYTKHCGYSADMSEKDIEEFMRQELNLSNIINVAKGSFNKVEFVATSVMPGNAGSIKNLTDKIFKNVGIR